MAEFMQNIKAESRTSFLKKNTALHMNSPDASYTLMGVNRCSVELELMWEGVTCLICCEMDEDQVCVRDIYICWGWPMLGMA